MLQLGNMLENTPIGCRITFVLCAATCALYKVNHHLFVTLDLVCRPVDVVYGWELQRLLLASFVHKTLVSLLLALGICWRRFSWLEHQSGTLGFVLWFTWVSVILHGAYCGLIVILALVAGDALLESEVRGLFPLIIANLVASIKDTDNSTVWLWPLPFHISVRAFPLIVIALSWLLHLEAHVDVLIAYALGATCPEWFFQPSASFLNRVEDWGAGKWLLHRLQGFEGFVARPPESSTTSCSTGSVASSSLLPALPLVEGAIAREPLRHTLSDPGDEESSRSGCVEPSGGGPPGGGCGSETAIVEEYQQPWR